MQPDKLLASIKTELGHLESGQPLHRQLRSAIEALVLSSTLKPGEVLPGEEYHSRYADMAVE